MLLDKYTTHWTVTFEQVREICAREDIYHPARDKYAIYRCDYRGRGGFWWFDDMQELKFFLTNVWPVHNYMSMIVMTEETYVDFHSFESWYRYVAGMDNLKGAEIVKHTNRFFYGENAVVSWVGTLSELECSSQPEPVAIRKSFHHSEKEISTEERTGFMRHVSNRLEIPWQDVLSFYSFEWLVRYLEKQKKENNFH